MRELHPGLDGSQAVGALQAAEQVHGKGHELVGLGIAARAQVFDEVGGRHGLRHVAASDRRVVLHLDPARPGTAAVDTRAMPHGRLLGRERLAVMRDDQTLVDGVRAGRHGEAEQQVRLAHDVQRQPCRDRPAHRRVSCFHPLDLHRKVTGMAGDGSGWRLDVVVLARGGLCFGREGHEPHRILTRQRAQAAGCSP